MPDYDNDNQYLELRDIYNLPVLTPSFKRKENWCPRHKVACPRPHSYLVTRRREVWSPDSVSIPPYHSY